MCVRWNELARFALAGRSGRSADVDVCGGKWMCPLCPAVSEGEDGWSWASEGRARSLARWGVDSGDDNDDLSTGRDREGDVAIHDSTSE